MAFDSHYLVEGFYLHWLSDCIIQLMAVDLHLLPVKVFSCADFAHCRSIAGKEMIYEHELFSSVLHRNLLCVQ